MSTLSEISNSLNDHSEVIARLVNRQNAMFARLKPLLAEYETGTIWSSEESDLCSECDCEELETKLSLLEARLNSLERQFVANQSTLVSSLVSLTKVVNQLASNQSKS